MRRTAAVRGAAAVPVDWAERLRRVEVRQIWRFLLTQPASFWLICAYLFFEYVRPQSIWPALDVLPWARSLLILCTLALFLEGKMFRLRTPAAGLLVVFSMVVLASSVTAFSPETAFDRLPIYLSWVLVFLLITNIVVTEERFFIFLLSFLLYSLKMSQHAAKSWASIGFAFRDWGVTGAPGWFHNSGEFGIQMCVYFPLVIAFIVALRRYWGKWKLAFFLLMPITALMGVVASSSRGAVVGIGAVLFWMAVRSRHRVKALTFAAVAGLAVFFALPEEQRQRFETAGEDKTSETRIVRWTHGIEIAQQHPVLGVGYANWRAYYPVYYAPDNPGGALSHNVFIEAWSELGYTGLLAFIALIGATFYVNSRTRSVARRIPGDTRFLREMAHGLDGALVGYLASGFFVTVLYYPYFWINLAMTVSLHAAAVDRSRRFLVAQGVRPTPARRRTPVRASSV